MPRVATPDLLLLIKTWATRRADPVGRLYPHPKTLDELKAQLIESGAGSIPDWFVDFELLEWKEEKLRIQLPLSETVKNAEARAERGKALSCPVILLQRLR